APRHEQETTLTSLPHRYRQNRLKHSLSTEKFLHAPGSVSAPSSCHRLRYNQRRNIPELLWLTKSLEAGSRPSLVSTVTPNGTRLSSVSVGAWACCIEYLAHHGPMYRMRCSPSN